MSLVKIPFLLSGAVGAWLALTPPNPPPSDNECQKSTGFEKTFGKVVRIHAFMWKASVILSTLIDIASILSPGRAPPSISRFLNRVPTTSSSSLSPPLALPPLFLLGWLTTMLSGVIRLACYRALGPLFTFEITLRENHTLVTTGPYACVRHPSYAGVVLGVAGTLLLHFGPGSWFRAAGLLGTPAGWWYAAFWTAMEAYVLASILLRAPQEDALLRREFKGQWDAWAARVPYRVVPGIY